MTFELRSLEEEDVDFVLTSWIYSYARSGYGLARGASVVSPLGGKPLRPRDEDWAAFWAEQRPIVVRLIQQSDITIACDPGAPSVVYGYVSTDGNDTLHQVLVKRSIHRASATQDGSGHWSVSTGISGDIYRALLGSRLAKPIGYTFEPVDMRRKELRVQGVTVPRNWHADSTWFARNWV